MKIPTTFIYAKNRKKPAKFDNKFDENAHHFINTPTLYLIIYTLARKKVTHSS